MPTLDQLLAGLGKQMTLLLGWGVLLGAEFLPPVLQTQRGEQVIVFEVDRYPREEMSLLLSRSAAMEVRYRVLLDRKDGPGGERETVKTLRYRSLSSAYVLEDGGREIQFRRAGEALRELFTLRVPAKDLKGCFVRAAFRLPELDAPEVQRELWPQDPRTSWTAGP